jgi:hypothetical protein
MKTGRRNKMDTVKILENLSDMGCDDKQIYFMKKMYEEGDTDTLLRDLRKCRCHLMDELHESQKKVDNMDFLIRQIQKEK